MQILNGKEYPEYIKIGDSIKYISQYNNNKRKVGIRTSVWTMFDMSLYAYEDNNICKLFYLLKQLFKKDKGATLVQWIRYSWLELKDFALESINAQAPVPFDGRIWLLQTTADTLEVYSHEEIENSNTNFIEVDSNIIINDPESKFNGTRLVEYEWDEIKQRFLKVEERTSKSIFESISALCSYIL